MTDELTTPIGVEAPARRNPMIGWVIYGFAGVIGTIFLFILGWFVVVNDPSGGNPSEVAVIDYSKPPVEPTPEEQAVDPNAPKISGVPGGAKILTRADEADVDEPPPAAPAPQPEKAVSTSNAAIQNLSSSPDGQLVEKTSFGLLPVKGANGSRAVDTYARPSDNIPFADRLPKVAIIVSGIGLSQTTTQEAIRKLPGEVGLAFAPYGNSLTRWLGKARQNGHEILLQVPMEPYDYPDNDPGPHTLRAGVDPAENTERLRWILGRITNYVGVVNYMGARLTAEPAAMTPIINEIADRGLLYLDDGSSARSRAPELASSAGAPFLRGDVQIDGVPAAEDIDSRLLFLEQRAKERGYAIGMASAFPVSLERISLWAKTLESRGIVLVPVTRLLKS